jgi:hypothetical protein
VSDAAPPGWSEIYERLARRPDRPDPLAWDALERRVRTWTRDDDVAAETCAEVWRTFNLARGGAAFEGFVQGRLLDVATERGERTDAETADAATLVKRMQACLTELRTRNALHHSAITLLYEDRATVPEAADALRVDGWTVRALAARARQALAQCLERGGRSERAGGTSPRSGDKPRPARPRPARQRPGRPGGRPPRRRAE